MNFFNTVLILLCIGVIVGGGYLVVEGPRCTTQPNQHERQRLFQQCMAALPAGPQSTVYNDWDEVVDSCENAAYYQSLEQVCR